MHTEVHFSVQPGSTPLIMAVTLSGGVGALIIISRRQLAQHLLGELLQVTIAHRGGQMFHPL